VKGQVAIEYLVTYGWALFAFTVVLAIIASFISLVGITGREYCLFPPQLVCTNFLLDSNAGKLMLNISNNFGFPVMIRKVELAYKGEVVKVEENQLVGEDGYFYAYIPLEGIKAGEYIKGDVLVWYRPCPKECVNEDYVIKGTIVTKAV
jgi:hypothetical protein